MRTAISCGDVDYYNGFRGYRYARTGYREYNGWWYPPAAFPDRELTTGSIRVVPSMDAHIAWCMDHYITYRPADNTYSPPRGPRRECRSPYE